MKQILSRMLLLVVVITAIFGLSSCKIFVEQEPSTYDLIVNNFERNVVYGSELDLSGLDIEVTTEGEVKHVAVTKDMITSGGTTTSVGEQEMIIEYGGLSWSLYYEVFYKIDHIVDGFVYDSQMVMSRDELLLVKDPKKENSIFIGWNQQIPDTLTGNLRIEAMFADGLTLPEFTATYGDTLANLTLPEAKDGHWEWKDSLDTSVGNAGTNKFTIAFIPDNPVAKRLEFVVDVAVAKKKLEFIILNDKFEYDGTPHSIDYELSDGVDPSKVNIVCFGTEYASDIGIYNYNLRIFDQNYEGQIKGSFEITKIKLIVDVLLQDGDSYDSDVTITYGDPFPDYKVFIKDKNGKDYVLGEALEVSVDKPSMLIAGYYDILATIKDVTDDNNNDLRYYDITYNVAKLVVAGVDFDPGPPLLKENYDIYYGDLLSSIEFADHPNGVWVWDYTYNAFAVADSVGNAGKNTFRAEFIPKDSSYNKSEAYIVLDVNKKILTINVDPASTTVVYDGKEHGLSYVVVDPVTGRVFDDLIVTGDVKYVKAYENGYNITLYIDDANYTGSLSTTLKIRKADPVTDFSNVITLTWRSNLKLESIALDSGYEWKYKNTTIDIAGEYIFDVVFTPEDTDNYNVINGKIKVIVEKAQSSITDVEAKYDSWTYNGSDFELSKGFFGYESIGGTVKYLYNGEVVTTLKNAGEYLIKMVIEENDNYLGCEVSTTVVINKADPQITQLNITNWTYGEESNDPSAKTTFGNIVYKYYIKGSEGYVLFGEDGLTAPTEAGIYYVHATVAATNDWNGAESIYKEFKIDKQIVELPEIESIVYQGKLIKPTVPESALYSVAENGNEGGENVGEYMVTLVLADSDNYRWEGLSSATATVKYKITKYNSNVIDDFDGGEWTYEDTVSHSTKATFGEVRYTYYLKKVNGEYEKVDEAKNAGEYKVEARVSETDNYNGYSIEKTFVIDKKSVDVPSLSDDQLSFVYTSKTITSGFKAPEGAYYKVSDVGGKEVGDYYVTLTLNSASNYKWDDNKEGAERKLKYSIVKDEVSITKLTIENWKYKDTINSHTVEIDRTYTFANIVYQYKTPDGEWVDTTITRNSVAGDYRVVATVADTTNYDGDVEIVEFKINKADSATINNIITGKKYTTVYNKDASYTIPGLSGSHTESTLTYTITKNGASVTEMKNAGTYTVVITLPESDNYEEVSEIVTVEISKKEISKPTLSSVSNIYNGGTFVPTPSSSADYTHAFENEASIAAGTYKVTFTLTDTNYVWDPDIVWESGTAGVLTYTIQKANIGIEGNTSNRNNVPYTLAGYTLTDIVAKGVNVESTLIPTITLGGEEVDAITAVGIYTVTYNYNDTTGNYNNRKVEFTVNITKATNRFTSNPAGGKSWTYGNVVDTTVFGAKASFGEVKYRFFSDAEGNNPLTVTSETRLGYGTYYVQAYVDDNSDNYDDCESSIVAFNITKATATISGVISSATSVYGQYATTTKDQLVANSSVTLAYGSAVKPAVTIMFTPVSGGTATPADTIYNAGTYVVTYCYVDDNHNSVTETATVFIDRADTTIDVVESVSKVYDNTEYVLPVTVKVNGVDITLGENGLTYVITKNDTPVDEIKNAGNYTITYTYAVDANYKAGTDTTTVVVDKANPVITPWTDHKLVYDTTSAIYKATATASGVEIDEDKYISVTYYTKSGDKYTPINAPVGKGTYYYVVSVSEGENWYSGDTDYVEFTIAQGQANITGFATTSHQYNGSVAPIPTAHTNLGNVYYYFKSATKSNAKFERWTENKGPQDADTYIVYAEVINDVNGNYLGDKTAEINYVITPASTIITAGNIGKTYGFSYTTLESLIGATYKNVGNVDATAGLKYEITGGDTDKLKDGKIVNVGSYKVTVTLTDTNYTAALVEITVTVSPKSATITAENKETYYKGSEYTIDEIKSLISASIDGIVAGDSTELTYTVSGGKTIENQGAYEVIVSYTSDNYTVISVPVTVTVKPASTSIITNNVNKTYGFTYESLESLIGATYKDTSGADATANLKYEITGGDINKLVNGNIVNAGTYTITVSLTDTNYTAAPTEVTVYVAPKPFSGTVTVNATYDDKLSSVELPVVEGGHLEWHNGANKVGTVGNQKWLARFVADNSGNYANVENVSVTVVVSTKFVTKPVWAMNQTFDYDAVTNHSAVITNLVDAAYYDIVGNGNVAANEDGYTVTITLKSSHGNNIEWVGGTSEVLSFKYYVTKASTSIAIEGFAQNSNNTYATDLGKYDPTRTYTIPAGTVALKDGTTATAGYIVKYIPNVGDTVEDFKGDIKAAGTYIITYTYAGNSNHSASSDATLTVTIGKADSSVVITPAEGDSIGNNTITVDEYDGKNHLPTVTINGVITNYSSDKYAYAKPEGFIGSVTEIIGETAGTYTLVYSLTNDNNYADISETVTLVIAQVENNDEITVAADARFDDKVLSKIILPGNANGSWSLVIVGVTTDTSVDKDTVFEEVTTYTYKATFTSTNVNYAHDYEEGTITVGKKLVTEPTVDDIVYTGDWIYPDPKIEGPYTVTANAGGQNHNTDPKEYYVEFTLESPETHEWSKASDSINDIDGAKIKVYYDITNIVNKWQEGQGLAIKDNKWTYNFGETIPVPTAMPNEGTPYIQFRIKGTDTWTDWAYYDLTTEKWITTGNAPENNGTYEIRAIVYADNDKTLDEATDGKGNNYDRLVSATQTLVINKATVTIDGITIVGGNNFEYLTYTAQNTSTLLNGVSLKSDVTGGAVEGTVSVNVEYDPVIGNTVENYSGYIKNAGTYTIVYTFDGTNTNYVTETETIVITIKQSAASINGANDERMYSHEYDSDVYVVPGITPSHNEGTLVPTVTKDGVPATLRNVGTYKVTYTLAETNNYYAATSVEVTVTITPASATITADNKEFKYNGTAYDTNEMLHALIGTSVTGIIAGDPTTLTYTVSDNKTIENYGTYTVTIVLDDPNYGVWNAETETYDKVIETVTVNVLKKDVSIEGIDNGVTVTTDKSGNTLVYHGETGYNLADIIGAYFVGVNGDEIKTGILYNENANLNLADANEIGYEVTISLDNNNYEAAPINVKVVIEKAEATISLKDGIVNNTVTKNYVADTSYDLATYIGASASYNGQPVSGIEYYVNGSKITDLSAANETGYKVVIKLVHDNYVAEETVTFRIMKAKSSISGVTDGQKITVDEYDGENHLPTVTINGNTVEPSYSYTKPEGFGGAVTETLGVTAGTYTLVYSFAGDSNYNPITATVTLIINQVKNEDDVKWEFTAKFGDNVLDKFNIPDNENGAWSIEGVDENTTFTTMDKNTFKAIFTSDNVNYADRVIEGIEITVDKRPVSIEGIDNGVTVITDKSGNKLVYRGSEGYAIEDIIGAYFKDVNDAQIKTGIRYNGEANLTLVNANENGYTVTITLVHDNYVAGDITVTVKIERMALVVPEVTGTYIYTVENGVEKVHDLTYTSAYDVFKDLKLANGTSLVSISGDKNSQAGTNYNVVFTLNDVNNYKWVKADDSVVEGATATAPYVIGKATPVITIGGVTVGDDNKHDLGSREYGAAGYAELPEVEVNGVSFTGTPTIKYQASNTSTWGDVTEITDAGTYVFTYKSAESANYLYREVTVTLKITKATEDHVSIIATGWTNAGGQFDSDINYPTVTVKVNALTLGTDKYKVYYATSNAEDADWSEDKPTYAGTYYVKVEVAEDATNYFGATKIFDESFEITKKPTEIKITGTGIEGSNGAYTYNFGSYTGGTYTIPTGTVALANDSSATATYSNVKYEEINGTVHDNFTGAIQAAGTYVITYTYAGDDNHAASENATLTVTISKAALSYSGVTSIERYYGTEGWTAIADTITVSGVNGETYEAEKITNVTIDKADKYEVTYQYGDNNYNVITTVVTYDIQKAIADYVFITATGWTDAGGEFGSTITYPKVTVKVNALTLTAGYTVYYSTSKTEGWDTTPPTSAGTYYVKVEVAEDATNYFGATKIFDESFEITKKPTEIKITGTGIEGSNGTYTYNFGSYTGGTYTVPTGTVALANGGSTTIAHSKVSYTPYVGTPDDNFTGAIKAAGTYTITYNYTDSAKNHADSTAILIVTIGQASLSYNGETSIERTYGDESWKDIASSITLTGVNGETRTADKISTNVRITGVDTYEVTYKFAGDNNYGASDDIVITITVSPRPATITAENKETYYKGSEYTIDDIEALIGASIDGIVGDDSRELTYTVSDNKTIKDHGTYKVIVSYTSDNYTVISVPVTVTVKPKSATITAENKEFQYNGTAYDTNDELHALIGASISGIVGDDSTELTYTVSDGKIIENYGTYTVTVSYENGNYTVASVPVTVTVTQKETSFELQSGKENAVNDLYVTEDETAATTTYVATATQSYGNITDADIFQHAGLGVKVSITSMTYNGTALPEDKWAIGDAGEYVITYSYDGSSGNYASATLTLTLTVDPINSSVVITPAEGDSIGDGSDGNKAITVGYDGKNHLPTVKFNGAEEGAIPSISYTPAVEGFDATGDGINSGVYVLTYTFGGDVNHNPIEVTVTLTITRLTSNNVEILHSNENNTDDKWIYGETLDYYVADDKEIKYYSGTYDAESNKIVYSETVYSVPSNGFFVVGYYKAVAQIAETVNYPEGVATKEFTVSAKTLSASDIDGVLETTTTTYGQYTEVTKTQVMSAKLNIIGDQIAPDIKFQYAAPGSDVFTDYTGSIYNAGTYKITYSLPDGYKDNYAMNVTVTITINKATPTITHDFGDAYYFENQIDYKTLSHYTVNGVNGEVLTLGTDYTLTIVGVLDFNGGSGKVAVKFESEDSNYADIDEFFVTGINLYTVAKLNNSTAYGSIENALAAAGNGDVVWVLPMSSIKDGQGKAITANNPVTITANCNVNAGVTLLLPYGTSDDINGRNKSRRGSGLQLLETLPRYAANETDGYNLSTVAERVTYVVLAPGCEINVYGTIEISGVLSGGSGGSVYAGQTSGLYAELSLSENSKIELLGENAKLESFGFITETIKNNGSEVIVTMGTLYQPFVMLDFNGGSYKYGVYAHAMKSPYFISPFHEFTMMNVQPQMTVYSTGKMTAWANLYAGQVYSACEMGIFSTSSSSLFDLKDGAYIVSKYDKDTMVTDLDLYGGAGLNVLSLNVKLMGKTFPVSTDGVYFPIPWSYDISLNDGEYTIKQKAQLMWGSRLVVEEDAKLILNDNFAILDTYYMQEPSSQKYGCGCRTSDATGCTTSACMRNRVSATFIVRGEVVANAAIAGRVYSDRSGAKIMLNGGTSIDMYRTIGMTGEQTSTVLTMAKAVTLQLKLYGFDNDSINIAESNLLNYAECILNEAGDYIPWDYTLVNNAKPVTYVCMMGNDGNYYLVAECTFENGVYTPYMYKDHRYDANKTDNSMPATYLCIKIGDVYVPVLENFDISQFEGSYVTSKPIFYNGTVWTYGVKVNTDTNIGSIIIGTDADVGENYTVPTVLPEPKKAYYTFDGWFVDEDCTVRFTGTQIIPSGYETIIYARWIVRDYDIEYENNLDSTYDWHTEPTISGGDTTFNLNTTNVTLPNVSSTDNSHTFVGWYLIDSNGQEMLIVDVLDFDILAEYIVNPDGKVVIYAKWTQETTYEFIFKESDSIDSDVTMPATIKTVWGSIESYGSLPDFATTYNDDPLFRYEFIGWSYNGTLVEDFAAIKALMVENVTTSVEIQAVWKTKIQLTIKVTNSNSNDGFGEYNKPVEKIVYIAAKDGKATYDLGVDVTKDNHSYLKDTYSNGWETDGCSVAGSVVTISSEVSSAVITNTWLSKNKLSVTISEHSADKNGTNATFKLTIRYSNGVEFTTEDITSDGTHNFWLKPTDSYKFDKWEGYSSGNNPASNFTSISEDTSYSLYRNTEGGGTCLAAGTLITLADGTKKAIEDLRQGDMVMAFDHLTGVITTSKVIIVVRTASDFYKNTFVFDDGTRLATINEHGIYDLDLNKYVNISHENYHEFLGHRFVSVDVNGNLGVKTLIDVECVYETGYKYDIVSEQTLNYVAEDTLSVTHVLVDIINTFEFNENMIYDQEKMMADIEKYGLYTYDEWEEHCDISVFDEYNIPIMKIGVEKGLYTEEYIIYLINRFVLNDDAQIK